MMSGLPRDPPIPKKASQRISYPDPPILAFFGFPCFFRSSQNYYRQSCSGEKRVYTTTVGPFFSRSVARPRGHRAKKAMVYTIFLGKQGKRVYTIGPERWVYTMEPQTQKMKKEKKEGLHGGGVYFFLPCCYSWEFVFPKLPLPLPSWNSDEFPLPLPSWRPQSPLHFHWFPITVLKVIWLNFPQITVTVTVLKCFWIRKVRISNMTVFHFPTFLAFLVLYSFVFHEFWGVPRREKPLLFVSLAFFSKKQGLEGQGKVVFLPCFFFCKVILGDPPKVHFKTSVILAFARLFLPCNVKGKK